MHPGRVIITNPGGLPNGLTVKELGLRTVPRNRLIADLLYRMGYVERLGSGIHRMQTVMKTAGLPAPRFSPTDNSFVIKLYASFEAAGVTPEEAKLCRWLLQHEPASLQGMMNAFNISKTTAYRQITRLVAKHWVEINGSGRSTTYSLSYTPAGDGTEMKP